MLYVYHGSNIPKSVAKAHALISSLRTKRPDAAYVAIDADAWHPSIIEEHLGGQGLFSNKYIIFLDRLTENAEAKEAMPDFIPAMQESANIFIVLEGKLLAEMKKAIAKHAEKVVETEEAAGAGGGKKEFNVFALGDAIGARDAFKAWSVYREAVDHGTEPENILGTLFWQVKSMALSAPAKTAGEAGLNPFVFGKSKKFAGNYSGTELQSLMEKLIVLYHDGHRGRVDMELAVERAMLGIGK